MLWYVWALGGAAILVVGTFIYYYNRFVLLSNRIDNSLGQIDVQLKRRYDLIPNLVEIAKGYMKHERETLEAVIAARNSAFNASAKASTDPSDAAAVQQLSQAEGTLNASLGRLFALSEAYPDLKANQNMLQLTEELTSTENKISFSRQAYNDSVMQYNTMIEQFPGKQSAIGVQTVADFIKTDIATWKAVASDAKIVVE